MSCAEHLRHQVSNIVYIKDSIKILTICKHTHKNMTTIRKFSHISQTQLDNYLRDFLEAKLMHKKIREQTYMTTYKGLQRIDNLRLALWTLTKPEAPL